MPTKYRALSFALAALMAASGCASSQAAAPPVVASPTPSPTPTPPPPEDGGTYWSAEQLLSKLEKASPQPLCDQTTYDHLVINGQDLGADSFGVCRIGVTEVKVHIFPLPVIQGLWYFASQANMRGDYIIVYGKNWFISASGNPDVAELALDVLGGDIRTP